MVKHREVELLAKVTQHPKKQVWISLGSRHIWLQSLSSHQRTLAKEMLAGGSGR